MIHSYSSIATYKQCPAKWNWAYRDKFKVERELPSPAMERGIAVHDSVESYFKGGTEYLHPDIHKNYGKFMFGLRNDYSDIRPEFKWGVTWEYEPCEYNAPNAMLHGYVDLLILPEENTDILQYEWKTGGIYKKEHRHQGITYATAMMAHFPDRPGVDSMITYFDKQEYDKINYPASMMFEYKPSLRREIGTIADATKFPPMPSFKCKWCPFSRYHGGPCQF